MLQYIEKVLILYVGDKRDELNLPLKHPALAIFDVFSAHRHETVLDALYRANIKVVFVPARCTDNLQPLDLKVNKIYKDLLKSMFQNWYADGMGKNLRKDKKFEEIDMWLSVVKPLHASWLVKTHKQLKEKTDLTKSAFVATGITCNR